MVKSSAIHTLMTLILLFISSLLFLLPAQAAESSAKEETAIVVSRFKSYTYPEMHLGSMVQNGIMNMLQELKYFKVVELNTFEQIMKELEYSPAIISDERAAAELGRKSAVDVVCFGSVHANYLVESIETQGRDSNPEGPLKQYTAITSLQIRLFDVNSERIIYSHIFEGRATDRSPVGDDVRAPSELIREATLNATRKLFKPLQKALPLKGLVIKKEKKDGKKRVYVDLGYYSGVKEGDLLYFYRRGERIVHPITGAVLTSGKGELIAKEKVTIVFDDYSVAFVTRSVFKTIEIGMIVEVDARPWQGLESR